MAVRSGGINKKTNRKVPGPGDHGFFKPVADTGSMKDVASGLATLRYIIGAIGLFIGFYYFFGQDIPVAVSVVALVTTGFVGIIAFISHVVFSSADAARIGVKDAMPFWQWEVGFANLGFAVAAIIASVGRLPVAAPAIILLGYALYLLQAGVMTAINGKARRAVLAIFFSVMMLFFATVGVLGH
jgi:hypothetical protein